MPAPVSTPAAPLGPAGAPSARPVTLPAVPKPAATRYSGPYRFVRGPLVSRPGGSAGAENDVDVFLRMNRALPIGRVVVSVNGASPALTAGGAGFDQVDASTYAAARCYEITVGNTQTLTHSVVHYHLGEVVTVVVRIVAHSTDENGRPIVGSPATAEARVVMGKDSFPPGDPDASRSPYGYPLLGCPPL
jgi:hypothetical protein